MTKLNIGLILGFAFHILINAGAASAQEFAKSCIKKSNAKYTEKVSSFNGFNVDDGMIRVIIGFRPNLGTLNVNSLVPGRVLRQFKLINAVAAEVRSSVLQKLARDPRVRMIEFDAPIYALDDNPVNSSPQETPHGIKRIHAAETWQKTRGKGTSVAIIDTGIDSAHPDLAGRVVRGMNFTSEDKDAWKDDHGHGTHVAGTVAANDNDIGVIGVAPEADLIAVKVLDENGSGTFANVIAGIDYVTQEKFHVANMSLGATRDLVSIREALKKAQENGVIVAAAAGNSGENFGNPLNYPGAYPEVISVAAVDEQDQRTYFSTYNKFVDIAAHGLNVLSLGPDGTYVRHSGTSMATPHVAGALALLRAAFPEATVAELKRRLVCNAEDQWPRGRDIWTGYGMANVSKALELDAVSTCGYLAEEETEPAIPEPATKPAPNAEDDIVYVKSTAFNLVNNGTDKQLVVTLSLANASGVAQSGVKVTSEIMEHGTGPLATATATTNANGEAQFVLTGFKCGKFMTRVISADAPKFSLEYGQTEANFSL